MHFDRYANGGMNRYPVLQLGQKKPFSDRGFDHGECFVIVITFDEQFIDGTVAVDLCRRNRSQPLPKGVRHLRQERRWIVRRPRPASPLLRRCLCPGIRILFGIPLRLGCARSQWKPIPA